MLQATKIFVDLPIRPARDCTNQCLHQKWVAVSISDFTPATPRLLVNILNFWKVRADHWWISDQFFFMSEVKFYFFMFGDCFFFPFLFYFCVWIPLFFWVIYPFSYFLINFLLLCENSLHVKAISPWSYFWLLFIWKMFTIIC